MDKKVSCDAKPEYELTLRQVCQMVEQMGRIYSWLLFPIISRLDMQIVLL